MNVENTALAENEKNLGAAMVIIVGKVQSPAPHTVP